MRIEAAKYEGCELILTTSDWEFVPPDKLEGMMQAWDAARGRERSR